MDFTLTKYISILEAAETANYNIGSVSDLFSGKLKSPYVVLRHDVDRKPQNSLAMARAEAERGIRSSYYFRSVKASFVPKIIDGIRDLGHEIGYHYEDWYLARYDKEKAIALFEGNLARLRASGPVSTICMHGSPLARDNNMTIWDHWDFKDHGVEDCILSFDYTGHSFFTDSGRTFGVSSANLRDELGSADVYPEICTTEDLCHFLATKKTDKIMISCHPERWSNKTMNWSSQFLKDKEINIIKLAIKKSRSLKS